MKKLEVAVAKEFKYGNIEETVEIEEIEEVENEDV